MLLTKLINEVMETHRYKQLRILFLFGILFTLTLSVAGQNVEFKKENFPNQGSDLKKALKSIKKGDDLFNQDTRGSYGEALEYYLEANHFNHQNASLNYRMGVCYLKSYDKSLALSFLETARSLDSNVSKQLCLYLGMAYQYESRFQEALKCFAHYEQSLSVKEKERENAIIQQRVKECEAGLKLKANPNVIQFDKLTDKVNSKWDEYCPVIDAAESIMAFTSRRKSSVGERINPLDGLYFEDIYFTFKDFSSYWDYPENPGSPLNGKANDATVEISADGNLLTIYKNIKGKDYICESSKQGGSWEKPRKLDSEINKLGYHQPSAAYTRDRKTIYYVSDQKGGFGGTDIYYSQMQPDGTWSPSKNLGPNVNSAYDEEAPFLFADSTLYFSSRGFNSMGGYDVFVSKLRSDGNWTAPVNMGVPLNSPGDDLYLVVSPSGESYVSSDRTGGYGGFDIYHIKFNLNIEDLFAKVPPVFIHGLVTDEESTEGVIAMVDVHGKTGDNLVPGGQTDSLGVFVAGLPSMKSYEMTIQPMLCDSLKTPANLVTGTLYDPKYDLSKTDSIPRTKIAATLKDYRTGRPLQFPVEIVDMATNIVAVRAMPDVDGKFSVELPSASSYKFHVFTKSCAHKPVAILQPENYTVSEVDGMKIKLENVYFDFDRSDIRVDAAEILNRHKTLFSRFESWKIVVAGHTDNMGSEEYNYYLSKKRAKAVVDYLIAKGIKEGSDEDGLSTVTIVQPPATRPRKGVS